MLRNFDVVATGTLAVLVGAGVLMGMIRYDLGPSGKLRRTGQWILGTALGTGVLAFALKLIAILVIANLPAAMLASPPASYRLPPSHPPAAVTGSPAYRWEPLPAVPPSATSSPPAYIWEPLPEQVPAPADNPTTKEKVALGRRLFHDRALSRDRTLSCNSCHDVNGSGTDGRATSRGIEGQIGTRNAPTVWNAAFQALQFWDGRASSLEEQASGPLLNPLEMGMPSREAIEQRLRADSEYRSAFAKAFGTDAPITMEQVTQAIAAYERTLITPDTPYDRFVRGDTTALSPAQLRGMGLFQGLGCISCHSGPNFSAASIFDTFAPTRPFPAIPVPAAIRYRLTEDHGAAPTGSDRGSWRVPSLRNVALTGPWFHNGAVNDLAEVVRIMAAAQLGYTGRNWLWSNRDKTLRILERPQLDPKEVDDIVAFLNALSSDTLVARMQD